MIESLKLKKMNKRKIGKHYPRTILIGFVEMLRWLRTREEGKNEKEQE